MIQPVKLETFWVSKTPGKPSECIKSTVTNLEKLRRTPSKIFKSSELAKIGNFQCYSCNRYYSFRQHFERHVQLCTHNRRIEEISDFEALRCLECNQSFSYLQHLKRHAAKHLGLDRFRCKLCNYSSYYWSDTKCHLATHKDIDFRSPEYYILNVTPTENPNIISEVSNNYNAQLRKLDLPRPMLKRRLEPPQSSSGIVKTLILTERDGMLKVVSDPNQIARMVNQQGSPPLKRLRIAADGNPSPAIIKALPEIQKVVMAPSLNTVKRESTLLAKNLPSPTLSDPTPSAEMFEPATDPDKQHPSWVRKPLKDPDAQPFKWDDDEDEDLAMAERMIVTESNNSTATNTSITLVMEDANKLLATDDLDKKTNIKSDRALLYAEEEQHNIAETASIGIGTTTTTSTSTSPLVAEKPVPDNFSEPPKLTKEIPMENVLSAAGICKEEDLQMPSISESDISAKHSLMSSDSVMTFMLDENNDLLLISPEAASNNSMNQIIASSKDFFRVSHPSSFLSSLSSTSTSTMSYSVPSLSAVTQSGLSPTKALNKPKSYWDMQHKNALRRLPTRGLVSTSNLAFPSASRRVNKTPDPTSSLADVGSTIVTATAVISDLAGSDDIITTNAVAAVDATTETTTTTSPSSSSTSLSSSSSSPSPKTEK